jgi:hypothetical protein
MMFLPCSTAEQPGQRKMAHDAIRGKGSLKLLCENS